VIRDYTGDDLIVEEGKLRNIYLHHKKFDEQPVLMLDGHSDEIRFMVKLINKSSSLNSL